ncbi:unnamed protein product [Acanthoscelides obtectus]|uniref:Uncharacterized protein n=1 Tax=Acanthoscelides obtectus TaxID=200917 RepID=A0A9P0KBE9_ACAOB|nr:unnamed protein product [Acanthoscelides obtectus]CAK1622867.1 hypothetical protein AOBTE_LOCUS1702 [Acanthoscelides obtectus]
MRSYPLREHSERPSLVRKSTNLHLEEYVDYHSPERPRPIVPRNNLKTSGLFDSSIPEEKFTTKLQPLIPFLREPCDSRGGSRPTSAAGSRRGSLKEDRLIPTHNHNLI